MSFSSTIEFKDAYSTNIQSAIRRQGVEILAKLSKKHNFDLQEAIQLFILADEEKASKIATIALSKLISPEEKALLPKGRGKPKGFLTEEDLAVKKQQDNEKRKAKMLEKRLQNEKEALGRGETVKVRQTRKPKTSQVQISQEPAIDKDEPEPEGHSRTPSPITITETKPDEPEFKDFPLEKHVMFRSTVGEEPIRETQERSVILEDEPEPEPAPVPVPEQSKKDKKHKKETEAERAERKRLEKEAKKNETPEQRAIRKALKKNKKVGCDDSDSN
jgi:hypothetical protein